MTDFDLVRAYRRARRRRLPSSCGCTRRGSMLPRGGGHATRTWRRTSRRRRSSCWRGMREVRADHAAGPVALSRHELCSLDGAAVGDSAAAT